MKKKLGGGSGSLKCERCGSPRYPYVRLCPKCYAQKCNSERPYMCKIRIQGGYRDNYDEPLFISETIMASGHQDLIERIRKKYDKDPTTELAPWRYAVLEQYEEE